MIISKNGWGLQVNLCQKLLFLHQLTHNMTTDCSIHENSKLKPGENILRTEIISDIQNNFCTQHVLPMSCKKKGFWLRFYHLPATDILIIFVLCANKLLDILKLFKLLINALQIKRDKIWFLGIINHKNQMIYQYQSLHFDSKLCITLNQPGS